MRNVFFFPLEVGGACWEQRMSGGGEVTGKGESRRKVNAL